MYQKTKYNYRLCFSILFFFFLSFSLTNAQNYNIRTFTTNDGLPHNNIRDIASDSAGFLWIATWDGLSRYDGYEFKNYYHIPDDSTSLPYFSVKEVTVDGEDNLWIMTDFGQLVFYNRIHDNFEKIPEFEKIRTQSYFSINNDIKGHLWLAARDMIVRRDFLTGTFTGFKIIGKQQEDVRIEDDILRIWVKSEKEVWLTGQRYIYHLVKESDKNGADSTFSIENKYKVLRPRDGNAVFQDFDDTNWSEFYESPGGCRWILSNKGLFKQGSDGVFREFKERPSFNVYDGHRLFVWGSEKDGLHIYNPESRSILNVPTEISQHNLSYYCQTGNLIWFSSRTFSGDPVGLTQLIIPPKIFNNFKTESGIGENEAVFSLFKDRNDIIWTGIRGRNHIHMIYPDGTYSGKTLINDEMREKVGHLRAIVQNNNEVWLGYYRDLLFQYDYLTNKYSRHYPDAEYFHTIYPEPNGSILSGSDKLIRYNPKTKTTQTILDASGDLINICCFYADSSGILWAGNNYSNLLRFNPNTGEFEKIKISKEPYNIEGISAGDNNDLWLALLGGGVCNYNILTKEINYFTTSSGLSNNTTYSILKDNIGFIWVSTNNGISRIDPATGLIRVFNQNDGLKIIEFNSDASFIADDGEFFFGGMGGFVGFYPDSISRYKFNSGIQKLIITDFKVSGEERLFLKPVNEADTLILFKGENNFQISFSSTDFINSDKTMYRYKLSDINNDWIETDSRHRNINYSNLKPGWYTLQLEASGVDGKFGSTKNITLRISPFFYQTNLFLISVPLVLVMIITSIIIIYIRQVKHKERIKQDELRLNALRGQMNPHFIFNSLNSINYFISNNDRLSANRYIADFSRLIRTILSNLDRNYIPLETELSSLHDYLKIEHLRFGDKFDYEISTEGIGDYARAEVLPGLVQPFIENAIWHGLRALENRKGKIEVSFLPTGNDRLKCIIEDDGIGRESAWKMHNSAENHKSKGINIVIERLQIISKIRGVNYELEISDLNPDRAETGTRVKIDLPIKIK